MVNNRSARLLTLPLKPADAAHRYIDNGPIYDLSVVQDIIRTELQQGRNAVWLSEGTEDALQNEFSPLWDTDEVPPFLLALSADDYDGSEWAQTSSRQWVDCDFYTMNYSRSRQARWDLGPTIYVKFGISRFRQLCVVVRLHPSRNTTRT